MKISSDQLARQLESAVGAEAVESDVAKLTNYAIDSIKPALLCFPDSAEQIAAALRICAEAEAAVAPWGGGTAMAIGNLPRGVDVVLALNRLNRFVEHDHANLTATVEAGMTLAGAQATVARQNQFAPFDAPHPAHATIGGIVSANLNGPRRTFYGSVRDLVIGMRVVLASGEQIKAGGKVVKNVAGYDMCKLFVGSLGTLGVITELTLRMAPTPEYGATVIASGTLPQVSQLAGELARSSLLPAAVVIFHCKINNIVPREWAVAVRTEGFAESVSRHIGDAQTVAVRHGLSIGTLRDDAHDRFWRDIADFPLPPNRLVYRLTLPRASLSEFETVWQNWQGLQQAPAVVADTAGGVVWLSFDGNSSAAEFFSQLVFFARKQRGHAVMFSAPGSVKKDLDVWGATPAALSLMREVKRQFDPMGLLNPGRFVGGI